MLLARSRSSGLLLRRRVVVVTVPAPGAGSSGAKRLLSGGGGAAAANNNSKKPQHLREYLERWMGATGVHRGAASPATTDPRLAGIAAAAPVPSAAVAVNGTPLTVAGKSYLVPTMRLPRGVSPDELRDGIKVSESVAAGWLD